MYWCTGIKGLACRLAKAKAGSGNEPQYMDNRVPEEPSSQLTRRPLSLQVAVFPLPTSIRPRLVKASLADVQSASNSKPALKSCNLIRKGTTLILKII
ncbi:hypothetical protein MJO28_010446 [Puccinia striiformis f. sp. tritici]|uniref:Uncharacterized protein n=1 Tax=Puccinia striiformis f. sp. tritici TaxID=168172 RepID=A0ACC0E5X0_9BASI|nr:hypothetical protein MJO28_010446 [Puccinia striiformis f. sp. tritici]